MKKIFTLFYTICMCMAVSANENFEKLIKPLDLGYTDSSEIFYLDRLDSESLVFTVMDKYSQEDYVFAVWTYNETSKSFKNISPDTSFGLNLFYVVVHGGLHTSKNKFFKKDGDVVKYIGYTKQNSNSYWIEYHLSTGQYDTFKLDEFCGGMNFWSFIDTEQGDYVVGETCNYSIYTKDAQTNQVNRLLSVNKAYGAPKSDVNELVPYVMKNKIWLTDNKNIYTIDIATSETDTLLTDFTRGLTHPNRAPIPTQFIEWNNEVYFSIRFYNIYTSELFLYGTIGDPIQTYSIWKSDGTAANTTKLVELNENGSSLQSKRLFTIENQLYFLGDKNTQQKIPVYKIAGNSLEQIDELNIGTYDEVSVLLTWGLKEYCFYCNGTESYNQPIMVDSKEHVPFYYKADIFGENKYQLYLHLFTIENDRIVYRLQDYLLDEIADGEMYQTSSVRLHNDKNDVLYFFHSGLHMDVNNMIDASVYLNVIRYNIASGTKEEFGELSSDMHSDYLLNFISYFVFYGNKSLENIFQSSFPYVLFPDDELKSRAIWKLEGTSVATSTKKLISADFFSVYPNPASKSITIQSTENLSGQMMIVGVDGKIHQTFRVDGLQQKVDINHLSSGLYVFVYQSNNIVSAQRVVITK